MKDETARDLVRKLSEQELPSPSWTRITLRARFEEQFAARRKLFASLRWVELVVYAGLGISIAILALWALLAGTAASEPRDPAATLVEAIASSQDPRVAAALTRIAGVDHRLLALRTYLRAGPGLAERWSWTAAQITAFSQSPENSALQMEIDRVRQAFAAANPGFDLWVNPQIRSLDSQLANWNSNKSVAQASSNLLGAFHAWMDSAEVRALPPTEVPRAAQRFLSDYVPTPLPTLAAPGLSQHGQMRAIDFQIRKDGKMVAGPIAATIDSIWEAAGWTQKLNAAVKAGSARFSGPLEFIREPWHYTYTPAPSAPTPVSR